MTEKNNKIFFLTYLNLVCNYCCKASLLRLLGNKSLVDNDDDI